MKTELLATGIAMGESPRWHDGRLFLSDWMAGELLALDADGGREVVARIPSFPFCFDWLPDGRMLVVFGSDGKLMRIEPDGSFTEHADLRRFSPYPWNEIVVDGRGNVYLNEIGFDFPGGADPEPGAIVLISPDGSARTVADGVMFPNGMAVTPDNSTLILAESYGERLTAYDISDSGVLGRRRVWAETPGDHPDGICIDADGAVWYADVGTQKCVRVAEGGEVLDTVEADRGCFACMLGGEDGRTLYVVANEWGGPEDVKGGQVLTARAPAAHAGYP